jgi:PAS domain S-box-containing protein
VKSTSASVSRSAKTEPGEKARTATERRLVDDLHTHPFELQMQNQELLRAKVDMERSRSRYLELFDFAPVGYFVVTRRGVIESLNLAAAEVLQMDRQRASNTTFTAYLDDRSKGIFRAHLESVFSDQGKHAVDLVMAGERRNLHVISRLIRGDSETPVCLSAAVDVTARSLAEEKVTQLNRVLEEANKDLEAFIYSISHDLRGPLRNMAGFAAIIAEDFGTKEEVQANARRILAANEKMVRLVDDLLRFSRLGRKPLEIAPVDLNVLVDEALAELELATKEREIVWRRSTLPTAECDRGLMRQVFVNLLSNALKYSRPRKPAVITIGTEMRGPERVILVQDNGVGFDMRYHDKLFGVFQRLHVSSEFEGNGVGLAMVARVLARHGGRAYAEGCPDKGAAFWFTFEGLRGTL